jgi:hypothetical protein
VNIAETAIEAWEMGFRGLQELRGIDVQPSGSRLGSRLV